MKLVTARSLTFSGTWLTKRAKDLARKLLRFNIRQKVEIVQGYLVQAKITPTGAIGLVVDPPGTIVVVDAALDPRGDAYGVGQRDYFDSRTGLVNGPFGYDDLVPTKTKPLLFGFGFDPNDTSPLNPWGQASLWRWGATTHHDLLRAHELRFTPPPGSSYPYEVADQVPDGTVVYSGFRALPADPRQPSYFFALPAIEGAAPNYRFMCPTNLGYMAFEYQGMAPVSAGNGRLTLVVVPVVRNVNPDQAVSWGESAVLFQLVSSENASAPEIVWQRLWSLADHPVDFFAPGPWEAEPEREIASPYSAPQASWDAFWDAWNVSKPIPAGGTRPNWTDAISAAWYNDRFVVQLRCCALNATLSPFGIGWDYDYIDAGGSSLMRFEITPAGGFTAEMVQYEVWDTAIPGEPGRVRPYDRWVAGELDTATVHCVNPLATVPIPGGIAEVRWCMEADRAGWFFTSGRGPYFPPDMASGRLEFVLRRRDETNSETVVTHTVNFASLGAGIQGPIVRPLGALLDALYPPTGSYKLWSLTPSFVCVSDNELAFAVHEQWQAFPAPPTAVKLAVLNLQTGAVAIRGDTGLVDESRVQHDLPVHLDCIQRTRFNADGSVAIEGVLLASVGTNLPVRISRDSGRTWQDYLTSPRPQGGAYYIGNPLMIGMRPGAAIV